MVKNHPYRVVLTVLAVMLVTGGTAKMIGQHNEGPWGGLPEWFAALMWFGFLGSCLVMVLLTAYLLVANLRWRRDHQGQQVRSA